MFKILDGREHFYQWDLDRKLIVSDASITQVHFCNKTDDESLVVEVYESDGKRVANVPNILLQDVWRICVYGYDKNYTKHMARFDVKPRSKPQSYVYSETEILNYNTLLERINKVDEDIEGVVEEFLEANPPQVDLTGYATEEYVNEAVGAIDIPTTDLSNYYTKEQTDKVVSDAVGAIEIPEAEKVDLSNYYTKGETDNKIQSAQPNLEPYALKSELPNLAPYALKTELPNLEPYALKSEIPTVPDVSGYQTEAQVNALIDAALADIGVAEEGAY